MSTEVSHNDNLTVVLHGVKDLRMETRPVPKPQAGEVQLDMRMVGICCSDVHYWQRGAIGDFVVRNPMVMGHEGGGVVTAVGEGVTNLKVGDRITIEPGAPCRTCEFCTHGRYNLCPEVRFCATPPVDGSMANTYCHPADLCFKVPDTMTWEEAALCEPVAVSVAANLRAGVGIGKRVLIMGAGTIGILSAMVARAQGAAAVAICDIELSRIEYAKKIMPGIGSYVVDMKASADKNAENIIKEALGGHQPNITIECSGAESAMQTAIYVTKSGGCVTMVGMGRPMANIPIINALCREVDIRGMFRYSNCFPIAISLIANKQIDPSVIVTHKLPLEKGVTAYELAANPASGAVKVLVDCQRNPAGSA
jgi:L-iditol 2-dehydrogenase